MYKLCYNVPRALKVSEIAYATFAYTIHPLIVGDSMCL